MTEYSLAFGISDRFGYIRFDRVIDDDAEKTQIFRGFGGEIRQSAEQNKWGLVTLNPDKQSDRDDERKCSELVISLNVLEKSGVTIEEATDQLKVHLEGLGHSVNTVNIDEQVENIGHNAVLFSTRTEQTS